MQVLDKGFVELQDVMGTDSDIVSAARTSYSGSSKGDAADKKLLTYLMQHRHDGPFEFVQMRWRIKAPIFVARQWMRHRTGSYNEWSRRYTEDDIEFYIPDEWRAQSATNKQGSETYFGEESDIQFYLLNIYKDQLDDALATYEKLLEHGVARELARIVLPVSLYTQFVWSVNLRNLLHFLDLRLDEHAQWEIREYAKAIHEICHETFPWTMEAWQEHRATYSTHP